MLLSPHFSLKEMIVSQIAARAGFDNTPDEHVLANLRRLCQTLEQVRALIGAPIVITSGYRCQALNQRIGGVRSSAHVLGLAADFVTTALSPRDLALHIECSDIEFDQLILEFDNWVHLGISTAAPRRQVLTVRTGGGYLPGIR